MNLVSGWPVSWGRIALAFHGCILGLMPSAGMLDGHGCLITPGVVLGSLIHQYRPLVSTKDGARIQCTSTSCGYCVSYKSTSENAFRTTQVSGYTTHLTCHWTAHFCTGNSSVVTRANIASIYGCKILPWMVGPVSIVTWYFFWKKIKPFLNYKTAKQKLQEQLHQKFKGGQLYQQS